MKQDVYIRWDHSLEFYLKGVRKDVKVNPLDFCGRRVEDFEKKCLPTYFNNSQLKINTHIFLDIYILLFVGKNNSVKTKITDAS